MKDARPWGQKVLGVMWGDTGAASGRGRAVPGTTWEVVKEG